jgi:hypothetical protein
MFNAANDAAVAVNNATVRQDQANLSDLNTLKAGAAYEVAAYDKLSNTLIGMRFPGSMEGDVRSLIGAITRLRDAEFQASEASTFDQYNTANATGVTATSDVNTAVSLVQRDLANAPR